MPVTIVELESHIYSFKGAKTDAAQLIWVPIDGENKTPDMVFCFAVIQPNKSPKCALNHGKTCTLIFNIIVKTKDKLQKV